jgi:hypothetical protein
MSAKDHLISADRSNDAMRVLIGVCYDKFPGKP